VKSGRHFLQIPGPTNVPDRVLRAIAQPTIDHRGPAFSTLGREVIAGLRRVFQTTGHVVIYPSSGTGAWEASLVNTLSAGDTVLMIADSETAPASRPPTSALTVQEQVMTLAQAHARLREENFARKKHYDAYLERVSPRRRGNANALSP